MSHELDLVVGGSELRIETGRLARQAHGAALVRYGETVVLATATSAPEPDLSRDFLPLFVEYREKFYAAGKIPGGFIKKEGRPQDTEIISARLIDRMIRPLLPSEYRKETQVVVLVLSSDQENDADVLGAIGASAALAISPIPFDGPAAAVRVGRIDGNWVVNPTFTQLEESDAELVVAGTEESINMVEGGAKELPEEEVLKALRFAHQEIGRICQVQRELARVAGGEKEAFEPGQPDPELVSEVEGEFAEPLREALHLTEKKERREAIKAVKEKAVERFGGEDGEQAKAVLRLLEGMEEHEVRQMVLEEGRRLDGRGPNDIRPITCEVGLLPRTHGSSLFTRGQTQGLVSVTLGTVEDEQLLDEMEREGTKSFMVHYYFPPFSVGEVAPIRGQGRREIGHGALAERALKPVVPGEETFPYTIRVVSEILESNGSSSMATVCGGSLALMDAGAPIRAAVAGIAMGLMVDGDRAVILTDILGDEDHLGDMDFKVAGTRNGMTAFQMDVKVKGLSLDLLDEALERAREARLFILDVMDKTIPQPRPHLSPYAPRIITMTINPEKIGKIIGPGGKVIRSICEETGAKINVDDSGVVTIASVDGEAGELAQKRIEGIVQEPVVGQIYDATVKTITKYGCFVEILPGVEGLVHISELDTGRVERVEDVVKLGGHIKAKLVGYDDQKRMKLSRKAALAEAEV